MTEAAEGTAEGSCTPLPPPDNQPASAPVYISLSCKSLTMAALAESLHNFADGYLDQPVVDQTNLAGNWDLTLKWSPRMLLEKQGADGISIFAAVEKQLGLKLELKTASRPAFKVVSVDVPAGNQTWEAAVLSKSGKCFWIKDISSGAGAGTFYGSGAAAACHGTDAAGATSASW